jgi:hypothetical protein
VDVLTWAQIPGGKAALGYQIFGCRLGLEFGEGGGAIQAEPSDNEAVVAQVFGDTGEHESFGAGARKGVTLPTHSAASNPYGQRCAARSSKPGRAAMVGLGCTDQPQRRSHRQ